MRQGIYDLLNRHLEAHWFQPGKVGEEIVRPSDRTVRLPKLNEEASPSFFSAAGMSWAFWAYCGRNSLIVRGPTESPKASLLAVLQRGL